MAQRPYYQNNRRSNNNNRYNNNDRYNNNNNNNNGGNRRGPRTQYDGLCTWWHKKRGFGFLAENESGPEYFVHAKDLSDVSFLIPGARVSFNVGKNRKGWFAKDVSLRTDIQCRKCGGNAHYARDCKALM